MRGSSSLKNFEEIPALASCKRIETNMPLERSADIYFWINNKAMILHISSCSYGTINLIFVVDIF